MTIVTPGFAETNLLQTETSLALLQIAEGRLSPHPFPVDAHYRSGAKLKIRNKIPGIISAGQPNSASVELNRTPIANEGENKALVRVKVRPVRRDDNRSLLRAGAEKDSFVNFGRFHGAIAQKPPNPFNTVLCRRSASHGPAEGRDSGSTPLHGRSDKGTQSLPATLAHRLHFGVNPCFNLTGADHRYLLSFQLNKGNTVSAPFSIPKFNQNWV